jgi:hypothetical protein
MLLVCFLLASRPIRSQGRQAGNALTWTVSSKADKRRKSGHGRASQTLPRTTVLQVGICEWLQDYLLSALNSRVTSLAKIVAG